MKTKSMRGLVTSVTELSPVLRKVGFRLSQGLQYKSGQSVLINGKKYALCGCPENALRTNTYEVLVQKQFGLEPTEGIQRVKAGDFFKVEGPLGHFSPIGSDPREENIWLTTPSELGVFLSFIQSREFQKVRPIKILLIVEVADERELHFREIFEAHHVTVISCVTQPSFWVEGFWGKMTDFLKSKRLRLDFQSSRFFIAANANLSKEIKRVLIEERNVLFSKIECLTEGSVAPVIPLVRKKEGVVNQLKAA